MHKLVYILAIVFLAGCGTIGNVDVVETPIVAPEGAITCVHKHDATRKFTYVQPIKQYDQTLFGETVITYEFTLISGETHFISGAEEENYNCELAN